MKKYVALMLVVGAMGVAACGDADPVEDATAVEPTTTVETTVDDPPAIEPVEVDSAPTQDEVDQKLADQWAKWSPKELAAICKGLPVVGEAKTQQMFTRILGPDVIKQGGSIDGVFSALMDRC